MKVALVLAPLAVLLAQPAFADSSMPAAEWSDVALPDAKQEAEAKDLMASLRCLVCQGQSIADSNAEMAGDMRSLVRRKIAAGEKPEDIRAYLVARYGRWVSYEPTLDRATWPLWIAPLAFLLIGGWIARGRFKGREG